MAEQAPNPASEDTGAQPEAIEDVTALRIMRERIDRRLRDLPGEGNHNYRLMQHLNRAMNAMRDAEDYARMTMPAWPTADRIRSVYEQLSVDVINGRSSVPTRLEQVRALVTELAESLAAARHQLATDDVYVPDFDRFDAVLAKARAARLLGEHG